MKLCLLNTTARSDSPEKKQKRLEMIEKARQGRYPEVAASLADTLTHLVSVKERVKNMFLKAGPQDFISQQTALLQRGECLSFLPLIQTPTLMIHAREDKNFSLEMHEEMSASILKAKLAIVEDSGHMSPMEAPQAITSLLRYWLMYF